METEFVKCEVRDYIAQVTVDRPPVNAVNAQIHVELMQVFDALSDRDDVRVAILTGAGLGLVASCDLLLASEQAVLGLPEINVGLLGGGKHAMRLLGHSKARRLMFTGQRLTGADLYRLGVVEECVPADRLMDTARALAAEIAAKSPVAIRLAKHAMNTIEFMSLRDGYRFEQNMTGELSKSEDSREAMRAFVEKRPPVFKGR